MADAAMIPVSSRSYVARSSIYMYDEVPFSRERDTHRCGVVEKGSSVVVLGSEAVFDDISDCYVRVLSVAGIGWVPGSWLA